jgi:hypothetical protein
MDSKTMRWTGLFVAATVCVGWCTLAAVGEESTRLNSSLRLSSVVPPLSSAEHRSRAGREPLKLPVADTPFFEHVRRNLDIQEFMSLAPLAFEKQIEGISAKATTPIVVQNDLEWVGTEDGLYFRAMGKEAKFSSHPTYGFSGPQSNVISGIAVDSRGSLWVATPAGLSERDQQGKWRSIRGRQGLPWEELTCIAIDQLDRIWLGSTRGLIQYRPYAEGRQWYYRAGERYLPEDHVVAVVNGKDKRNVYVQTETGWTGIEEVARTLHGKAEYLEARYQERHRRLGMPSPTYNDDAYKMTSWKHGHQASDALWTSYHIAAMCMAYTLTGEERYRDSAQEGMEALYFLQNVTGVHGLVARSAVGVEEPEAKELRGHVSWHPTADGKFLWRDDVSSDQMTGHYFAFYVYYQHIARHDPNELSVLKKQIRQVTDYMLDHNYQILDWDGEVTKWGWLNPEAVNDVPENFLENGIYSLMMLSFLKTAHHITGEAKYEQHYDSLIEDHQYLSNLLLQKKVFPDELNHSDDQLSALLFYSYMQLEQDPVIRDAVHRALRRHARIERHERNSLFAFVYASADPEDADAEGGIRTLREMPQDRRNWGMNNAHRADIQIDRQSSDGGNVVLVDVLPADERDFQRWNLNPYRANTGGNGKMEGTGVQYLLPYWMGRYHWVIGEGVASDE